MRLVGDVLVHEVDNYVQKVGGLAAPDPEPTQALQRFA